VSFRRIVEPFRTFADVARNPAMRNLQLAGIGSTLGIWAYGVAMAVYAYRADGATAVGLLYFVRWCAAGACAPWLALLADRMSRRRVMLASDVLRAALVGAIAAATAAGAPSLVVYALAVLASIAGAAFQPAESALLPSLATTPEELTAANVALGTTASIGVFVGPALAGILLSVGSTPLVFAVTAACFVWSWACISRISPDVPPVQEGPPERLGRALLAGFRAIGGDPRLRLLTGLSGAGMFVIGALDVLVVVVALSVLHTGNGGVGWLNAALGVGSIVGGIVASALAGTRRLARDLGIGLVLFGLPLAVSAATTSLVLVVALFALVGMGSTVGDVAGTTLLQRTAGDELLGRVFGVLQSLVYVNLAVGAALTPVLVRVLGARGALVAVGALLPLLYVVLRSRIRTLDREARDTADTIALMRETTIFAMLPGPVLEQLAVGARDVEVSAGSNVVEQGDVGDRFYILASGRVVALVDGREVRELVSGESFGEIALLRDVPRTATVRATEDVRLVAFERDAFLGAVTGHAPSHAAAERVVAERLPAAVPI